MRILYLTIPSFFDLEISFIRELKKYCDVTVMMILQPESMKSSAFSIDKISCKTDIIPAKEYSGMEKYKGLIDLNKWYIANNPDNKTLNCIKLAHKIAHFYKKKNFDLLHTTTNCKTSVFLLPYVYGIKHKIYTMHDPIPHNKLSIIKKTIQYNLFVDAYKNILLLSDALLTDFKREYKVKSENIFHSRLSIYDYLTSFPIQNNTYEDYILFFGRIEPYKGVDLLIEAYLNSSLINRNIKLLIAGKGKIETEINNPNIILINRYISNEELSSFIANCKFVVLPYISATQSGCVMSAYAHNKPVLATNVGDFPNEVIDGLTGMLVEPNNISQLSSKMELMTNMNLTILEDNIKNIYTGDGPKSWNFSAKMVVDSYNKILNE